jgi:catecholate siderophore receptor
MARHVGHITGIDVSREEFNNYAMVLPAGVVLNKNDPRTTIGTPNDGTSVEEGLRTKVKTRNFVAKALGVYAQDLLEIAPTWKLLAGLRWDKFEGDYVSPPAGANPEISRNRSDSLWSSRGVLWQPTTRLILPVRHLVQHSGELPSTPRVEHAAGKSRNIEVGAKLDRVRGRPARVALFHSTVQQRLRSLTPAIELFLSGKRHRRDRADWRGARPGGKCSCRTLIPSQDRQALARRHPTGGCPAATVDDAAAQRHLFTTTS